MSPRACALKLKEDLFAEGFDAEQLDITAFGASAVCDSLVSSEVTEEERRRPVLTLVPAPVARGGLTSAERQELTLAHRVDAQRMARSLVRRWHCRIETEELDSVVDLALCEAATSFDATRGTRFTTLLFYHLKGRLVQTITSRANAAKMSGSLRRSSNAWKENGSSTEAADELRCMQCSPFSAGDTCDCDENRPDDVVLRKDIIERCREAASRLRGLEREVMMRMYFADQEMSEITEALGYSRSHLSRVRMRALEKVRMAISA